MVCGVGCGWRQKKKGKRKKTMKTIFRMNGLFSGREQEREREGGSEIEKRR